MAKKGAKERLVGVGGWLLVFLIIEVLILLNSATVFIFFKTFVTNFQFALILYLILFIATALSIYFIAIKDKKAPNFAVFSIVVYAIVSIIKAGQSIVFNGTTSLNITVFLANLFLILSFSLAFITYFLVSTRVKNTFNSNITNPSRKVKPLKVIIFVLLGLGIILLIILLVWFFSSPFPVGSNPVYKNESTYNIEANHSQVFYVKLKTEAEQVRFSYSSNEPLNFYVVVNTTKGSVSGEDLELNPQKYIYPNCYAQNQKEADFTCKTNTEFRFIVVNPTENNATYTLIEEVVYPKKVNSPTFYVVKKSE